MTEGRLNKNIDQLIPSKLFGTYPQLQQGLYMQRIPIFAGQITTTQLRQIALIAEQYTNATDLHLTTRQDIELHNIFAKDFAEIQKKLGDIGLSTYGAGGDSIRNITVCTCCSFDPKAYNVHPAAEILKEVLLESPLLEKMPRKFKISFAGCSIPQSKPYVNDLSFLATSSSRVQVVGAGSLGARPETGIVLYDQLKINDIIPLTLGAIELFVNHGERNNRRKARLRHIRQRMGNDNFIKTLDEYFNQKKQEQQWPELIVNKGLAGWNKVATVQIIAGQLSVDSAYKLAEVAETTGSELRININHGINIYSEIEYELPEELVVYKNRPVIVACPGNTTCKNGLANCPGAAKQLSDALKDNSDIKCKIIAISGCPNNCAHSAVADLGLSGQVKTINGRRQEVYRVLAGGGNGRTPELSEYIKTITSENLVTEIKSVLKGDSK